MSIREPARTGKSCTRFSGSRAGTTPRRTASQDAASLAISDTAPASSTSQTPAAPREAGTGTASITISGRANVLPTAAAREPNRLAAIAAVIAVVKTAAPIQGACKKTKPIAAAVRTMSGSDARRIANARSSKAAVRRVSPTQRAAERMAGATFTPARPHSTYMVPKLASTAAIAGTACRKAAAVFSPLTWQVYTFAQ
jgi:hypothetical protein